MKRIWQLSLQLYPKDYRLLFGEEILAILEHKAADQCTNNPFASLAFNAAEILGLIRGAAVEWTSKIRQGAGYLDRSHREVAAPADAPLDEVTATRSRIEWNLRRMEHARTCASAKSCAVSCRASPHTARTTASQPLLVGIGDIRSLKPVTFGPPSATFISTGCNTECASRG
jgi:hypothetical protein